MRHLSTLAWQTLSAPARPWHAVVADVEADDAAFVARIESADDASTLTLARVCTTGPADELATLSVAPAPPGVPALPDVRLVSDGGDSVGHVPALCVITGGGDMVLQPVGDEAGPADVVGSVDAGILAAAWSPDEDLLVLITGGTVPHVLLMTRHWDVIHEAPLATDDFGTEAPVNVGWGSKATQFHGSEGKQAAMAAAQAPAAGDPRGPLVPDDDGLPRVSWRADGAYFVVSSAEPSADGAHRHRLLRVYTRAGVLSATSDPSVRGISHVLAVRPIGNLIATSQRMGGPYAPGRTGRHDIVFFERNGLRHGEFSLREDAASMPDVPLAPSVPPLAPWSREHTIERLAWNADGSILAVHLRRGARHVLQLWTTGNYHWYLKHEAEYDVLHDLTWHPEQPLTLLVAHAYIERRTFWLETPCSRGLPPHDAACAAVIDGAHVLLTPFRWQNVPPPMCAVALADAPTPNAPATPVHAAWATHATADATTDLLALLYAGGHVHVWALEYSALATPQRPRPALQPRRIAACTLPNAERAIQVALTVSDTRLAIAALVPDAHDAALVLAALRWPAPDGVTQVQRVPLSDAAAWRLVSVAGTDSFAVHDSHGHVAMHAPEAASLELDPLAAFCPTLFVVRVDAVVPYVAIGLAQHGPVLMPERVLAKEATSLTLTHTVAIWTTPSHTAQFLPLAALSGTTQMVELGRRVERGSRIVTTVPSTMALVLQMPRGNLETVYPRPLVLDVIRAHIDAQAYGEALRISRAHRVDLNLLHDHAPAAFLADVPRVLAQIDSPDHINLLLSSLRNEDVTATLYCAWEPTAPMPAADLATKVNRVCGAFLAALRAADERRYLSSILTAHVRQVPPDLEGGLAVLRKYLATDAALADEACKYIIFLVSADELYKVALGMYDLSLALQIAQHSPRDPREYVPFLRELRAKEPPAYQRFCIDDHLGRHGKALSSLASAGEAYADEAMAYMVQHKLYREGLAAWAHTPRVHEAYGLFGDYLSAHQRPAEAATAYQLAHRPHDALRAFREADQWAQALTVALDMQLPRAELLQLARAMSEQLEEQHKYDAAARVLLQVHEAEAGIALLCRAHALVDAQLACAEHGRRDLLETHVAPAALEAHTALLEEADDMASQLERQVQRLSELDAKRAEDPSAFYVDEDHAPAPDHVDVMSDVSQLTHFTRYTAATSLAPSLSTLSLGSKRTSRQKSQAKKEAKKKLTGRKGSVYEEGYLHDSLQKLLNTRLGTLQRDVARLLPVLATLGERARSAAQALQARLLELEAQAARASSELGERAAAQERERSEATQALAAQVLQLAHAPGAGEAAGTALEALWTWRHAAARPQRPAPSVSSEPWKLHLLEPPRSFY
ncbi:Putative elongator complex protein 1 [Malassezia caprae]|uniref:Elongator complex protein 1 n=1 Tax=Malassezia caprae TaxID=1381934 RepID=A0AAF0EBA0_9BASI|nr:Putative elongator complex protein 1 [Malassezia caprae]